MVIGTRRILLAAAIAGVTLGASAFASAQPADFHWSGSVAQGATLEVRGVNGSIRALPSADGSVHLEASREGRRSDAQSVLIEVVEHDGGITICAVYPTPPAASRPNDCRPGGGSNSVRENDVRVDFVVHVPSGVRFSASTVNGGIEATGLQSEVSASTVNGGIGVQTTGFVSRATTVNGEVRLTLPAGVDAEFHGSTVNGEIQTDFPLVVQGLVGPRTVRGTLGRGGPQLRVSTVNGDIVLRRS